MSSSVRRLTSAFGWAVASPDRLLQSLRAQCGALLDFKFEQTSPIPALPEEIAEALGRYEVVLPQPRLFRAGNQDLRGLVHLVCLSKALDAASIFEIGTYNGLTALTLAHNLPQATIHTLDLPPDGDPALRVDPTDRGNFIFRAQPRVFNGSIEAKRIVQHLGDSAEFDFSPFARRMEVVYIDGAHSLEYVSHDSSAAAGMLAEKGAVVWDDYWRRVPDVARHLHRHLRVNMFRLPQSRLVVWLTPAAARHLANHLADNRSPTDGFQEDTSGLRAQTSGS